MPRKATTRKAEKKAPAAVETSLTIEEQTQAFLAKGGKIDKIDRGVSGQQNISGPRHITISKKQQG